MKKPNLRETVSVIPASELGKKKDPKYTGSVRGRRRNRKTHHGGIPRPEGSTSEDILAMDDDDPSFKHPTIGRKRDRLNAPVTTVRDAVRADQSKRALKRRAKVRKHDAYVDAKAKENGMTGNHEVVESKLLSMGELTMDDWDDEELIRGYRRNRNGRFGPPPRYVPREVQQEAFRRLVKRGTRKMNAAYLQTIEDLIDLAQNADSEKVKLEAIKELMSRVVGKVPDKVIVDHQEEQWAGLLADAFVPVADVEPIEVRGVVRELGDGGETPSSSPSGADIPDEAVEAPPSPRPKSVKARRKKTT